MADLQIVRIDGIKWWITNEVGTAKRIPIALCPQHELRMTPIPPRLRYTGTNQYYDGPSSDAIKMNCAEGPHEISLPRLYYQEKKYVIDRIDAKIFKGSKALNLDDEALPIAKSKAASLDNKYFITAQLMESKRGLQAVIYAGEKGKTKKSQIFIEPETKKMTFDQNDLNPTSVFLKIEATFDDGSKHSITQ